MTAGRTRRALRRLGVCLAGSRAVRGRAGLVRLQLFRPLPGAGSVGRHGGATRLEPRALHRVCRASLALRPRRRSCPDRARLCRPRAIRLRLGGQRPVHRRLQRVARRAGNRLDRRGERRVGAVRAATRRHRAHAARRRHPRRVGTGRHAAAATRARRRSAATPRSRADGPYGWVRHPIYSGWFLVVFAVPVMTATQLVFAAVSSAYLVIGMVFEERSLLRAAPRRLRGIPAAGAMEGDPRESIEWQVGRWQVGR